MVFSCNALASGRATPEIRFIFRLLFAKRREPRTKFILIPPIKSGKIRPMVTKRKNIALVSLLVLAVWLGDLSSALAQTQVGEKAPGFITNTWRGRGLL